MNKPTKLGQADMTATMRRPYKKIQTERIELQYLRRQHVERTSSIFRQGALSTKFWETQKKTREPQVENRPELPSHD